MDAATREQLLGRFSAYLDGLDDGAPDDAATAAPAAPDLFTLLAQLAALKNDVTEHLLKLPGMPGGFARDLLEMQADAAQSATWRNYCIQFLGQICSATPDPALRKEVRERLYALADTADPETCGTALMALASLNGYPEIDSTRVAARAMTVARDAAKTEGLRLSALQVAAGLGHAAAAPAAREWLAKEKSANLRAIAIAVLGKCGTPADRTLIEPYLTDPDPRLNGAARSGYNIGLYHPIHTGYPYSR